jgi:uncharacterized protein YecE (DUF72 family)
MLMELDLFERTPRPERRPANVYVGTSGYSFKDWVGPFYPRRLKPSDYLRFYAERFDAVEVNSTYYAIPHPRVIDQMERKTPPGFRFTVKLNRQITHERSLDPTVYREYLDALEPLKAARKYDGTLAQFPWAFRQGPGALDHLKRMRERLPEEPLFVEFRHDSWATPDLHAELDRLDLGYAAVDEPALPGLMPPIAFRAGADGYVRFHGRNAASWWGGDGKDRYDYDYKSTELESWLTRIRELAEQSRRTYLFFNNCHAGQAARNAALMQELLRQQHFG